jgi:tetratricopeptide (TPR) repeat protein
MKKTLILLLLATALNAAAQTPQQLMQRGNDAYAKGDFVAAAQAYNAVLDAGYESADLYYNLGNVYYRQEEYGLSILNYERALRLKPNFRDAKQNLDLADSKTEDQIAALPEIFLAQWAHSVVAWFSPTGWRICTLILLTLLGTAVVIFLLSRDYAWRKGALIGGIVTLVFLLLCIACTISASVRYNRHSQAIVTAPMAVVKSSPEENSIDKLVLHEGTKVNIEETLGEWHKIQIADGNNGWLQTDEVTII